MRCLNCGIKHDMEEGFCPVCLNLLTQRANLEKIVLGLEEQIKETTSETKLKETVAKLESLCVEIRHLDHLLQIRKELVVEDRHWGG